MAAIGCARTSATLLRRMFYGASGLRAGWRALVFIALMVCFESQGERVLKTSHNLFGEGDTAVGWLFVKGILLTYVLVVVLIIGAFEGRSLADYGLPLRKIFGKEFRVGSLFGFGVLSANIALMVFGHAYSFGSIALPALQIVKFGVLWALADLLVALSEEFVFRGYLQSTLTRALGFWPASVLTSVLFGLAHLDIHGEPWTAIVNIALLSLLLCMALRRTGSLWFAIGSHAAFDWGLGFFYSCDRTSAHGYLFNATIHGSKWLTGSSAGPEGNILNVFLAAAAILLLSKIYPEVRYPAAAEAAAHRALEDASSLST